MELRIAESIKDNNLSWVKVVNYVDGGHKSGMCSRKSTIEHISLNLDLARMILNARPWTCILTMGFECKTMGLY